VTEQLKEKSCVMLLGPTGVAAVNIDGETIHSALHIPTDKSQFKELTGEAARNFCNRMEKVKFLVIDEYSMIGTFMLKMIDLRCRQGTGKNLPFGGLFLYMFGDIRQLPPVLDTALYATNLSDDGKVLISTFEKVFFLKQCFRQEDPEFQNILDNLSTGNSTVSDYDILSQRFMNNVRNKEEFASSLRLFATKQEVFEYNYSTLQDMKDNEGQSIPVAKIMAKHNNKTAKKGKADDADGMHQVLYLAKGAKVMLRSNLWVEKGLVNGTVGEVMDIVYEPDSEVPLAFPSFIMCKFSSYTGVGIGPDNLVPVPSILKSWSSKRNVKCTRQQFPLVLCYACSIYKAQGITVEKVFIFFGTIF
jgi:ATP-dependent DNA helicase PIF1